MARKKNVRVPRKMGNGRFLVAVKRGKSGKIFAFPKASKRTSFVDKLKVMKLEYATTTVPKKR